MITPDALAAAATGAAGGPTVVFPSVNITITFAFADVGSNNWVLGKSVRMVGGAARRQAVYRTFECVYGGDQLCVSRGCIGKADNPDPAAGTDIAVRRVVGRFINDINKGFCPSFHVGKWLPAILPERSSTRTTSAGLEEMSGAADRARVTFSEPLQSIWAMLISLLEFVIPIV